MALAKAMASQTWPSLLSPSPTMRNTRPKWPERDKLVCSKGHAGPAVYGTLAVKGFIPYEELKTLNRPGTRLPSGILYLPDTRALHRVQNDGMGPAAALPDVGQGFRHRLHVVAVHLQGEMDPRLCKSVLGETIPALAERDPDVIYP